MKLPKPIISNKCDENSKSHKINNKQNKTHVTNIKYNSKNVVTTTLIPEEWLKEHGFKKENRDIEIDMSNKFCMLECGDFWTSCPISFKNNTCLNWDKLVKYQVGEFEIDKHLFKIFEEKYANISTETGIFLSFHRFVFMIENLEKELSSIKTIISSEVSDERPK